MSKAEPKPFMWRLRLYTGGDNTRSFTPAQNRRARHKMNKAEKSPVKPTPKRPFYKRIAPWSPWS